MGAAAELPAPAVQGPPRRCSGLRRVWRCWRLGGEGLARCVAVGGNLVGHGETSSSSMMRTLAIHLRARLPRHARPQEREREREIGK